MDDAAHAHVPYGVPQHLPHESAKIALADCPSCACHVQAHLLSRDKDENILAGDLTNQTHKGSVMIPVYIISYL